MIPALNLLSPQYKKNLARTRRLLLCYEFLLLACITIAIGSGALYYARTILEERLQETTLAQIPGSAKIAGLNRDIRLINQALARIDAVSRRASIWSPRLTEIIERTPAGIRFNALSIDDKEMLTIQGVARTRNDLTVLRDKLGTAPSVIRVNLPLQYFIETAQVEFTVEIIFREGTR